jgi:hypothetical protein
MSDFEKDDEGMTDLQFFEDKRVRDELELANQEIEMLRVNQRRSDSDRENEPSDYMFKRYEEYRDKYGAAQREIAALKTIIRAITGSAEQRPGIIKLPVLDGFAIIAGNSVTVADDKDSSIQVSKEEWEKFRAILRFDDSVNYDDGETPMTVNQFKSFVELFRGKKSLETELEQAKAALK